MPLPARLAVTALVAALMATSCTARGSDGAPESTADGVGEVLRMALDDPGSLDPADADLGEPTSVMLADLLFDGLTAVDPDTLEPVPALASEWHSDDELTTWTFTLRPGAVFADGTPVTAADVVFTLDRIAALGAASTASVQLEVVEGYTEFVVDGSGERLDGVTAVDDATVQIVLTEPLATIPSLLSSPVFGIVPEAVVTADPEGFARAPTGSGPLRVDARDGDDLRLVPTGGDSESAGWTLAALDVTLTTDLAQALDAFRKGDVDVARIPNEQLDAAGELGHVVLAPYPAELFYGFNLDDPALSSADVRAAAVEAVNRRALVDAVYGSGVALLNGLVPAGVPGGGRDSCGDPCDHDAADAVALVEALGTTPSVTIDHDAGSPQDEIARRIGDDLTAAGFSVEVRSHPFDAEDPEGYQQVLARGEQGIFRLGWLGAYPSPEAFLSPLFRSDSPENVFGYSDSTVDGLLADARRTAGADARRALYAEAEDRIMSSVVVIPIAQFNANLVLADSVSGFEVTGAGTLDLSTVRVASG